MTMSLCAKDHKDVRGAYKERQRVLFKKDHNKSKNHSFAKPWKTSKGWGDGSGRECYLGRNYGRAWEQRTRWLDDLEPEFSFDFDVYEERREAEEARYDGRTAQESLYEADLGLESEPESDSTLGEAEADSYEVQLARALSLSLLPAESPLTDTSPEEDDTNDVDSEDGYSLMGTDAFSEAMEVELNAGDDDANGGHGDGEAGWVDVCIGILADERDCTRTNLNLERPTYAQMTKVEVT